MSKKCKLKANNKKKSKEDLSIYPIKIDDDKLNNGGDGNHYPLNNPVHLHLICGRVKSGKSLLMNNLYLSGRFYGDEYKTKILISSTAHNDAINKYMLQDFDFIFTDYTDDLLEEILDIIKQDEGDGRFLIIFDDMINSGQNFKRAGKTDLLTQIITTYRHIGNGEFEGKLAICMAVQYFKHLSPIARNNCSGYYIMGHFPESEIKKMSEALSIFGRENKGFIDIYNQSRKEPYDFLYLSVEHMEARRNHDDLLWSETGFHFDRGNGKGEIKQDVDLEKEKEKIENKNSNK
tara:strand:+ start:4827 stop:5699 length:873 start_codon:yes stop_codon:yes gene_type:complete